MYFVLKQPAGLMSYSGATPFLHDTFKCFLKETTESYSHITCVQKTS